MNNFVFPWCPSCSNNFPMREEDYNNLERNGVTFYCPSGHPLCITQESVASKLHHAERRNEYYMKTADKLRKRASSLRGVQTKYRNRLLCGHCPYCGTSRFQDLVKHIRRHHNPERV